MKKDTPRGRPATLNLQIRHLKSPFPFLHFTSHSLSHIPISHLTLSLLKCAFIIHWLKEAIIREADSFPMSVLNYRYCVHLILLYIACNIPPLTAYKLPKLSSIPRLLSSTIGAYAFLLCSPFSTFSSNADMLTFPLPAPLKNHLLLVRAGECYADARHEIQTNVMNNPLF